MKLMVLLKKQSFTVCVSSDDDKRITEISIDCAKYAKDENEPTESTIANLLVDIENSAVASYKRYDECADEFSLHEEVVTQLKLFYPSLQSVIRQIKRKTAVHRECTLRKLKKELNIT